jgi:trehalose 6-phosphate phosphatase
VATLTPKIGALRAPIYAAVAVAKQRDSCQDVPGDLAQLVHRYEGWCLFLDFDGTIVDIADSPSGITVPPGLVTLLERISFALDGALALVSGRSLVDLDRLLSPLRLPSAGVHGLERRDAQGRTTRCRVDDAALLAARTAMQQYAARYPDLLLEDKGLALALHYRRSPKLGPRVSRVVHAIAKDLGPTLEVQEGTHVCEIKPVGADKRTAVEAFLSEPPFAGRRPICVGDDATDRGAFRAVCRHGGLAIAVGARLQARWRLPDPTAVRCWLERLVLVGDPLL